MGLNACGRKPTYSAMVMIALVLLCAVTCPAGDAKGFPGRGSMDTWERAHEIYNEGYELNMLGDYQQAISKFRSAIILYPYDADFYYDLGNAYSGTDQWSLAEQSYRSSLKINDKTWSTWLELGTALKWQEKYADSKEALSKALQLNPDAAGRARIEKTLVSVNQKLSKNPPRPSAKATR